MNIFAVESNPIQAAQSLCDRHVIKLIVESTQMLANCFSLNRLAASDCPRTKTGEARRFSYPNHPCSKWARHNRGNMWWLLEHAFELCNEKYRRYPNNGRHFCHDFLDWAELNFDDAEVNSGAQTDFAVAIPSAALCRQRLNFDFLDTVEKYREYYRRDKTWATWKQNKPEWLVELGCI